MQNNLIVKNARQHNLKNISVTIPKNKLVVFTGLSGSGKSSLAFDTIYAEGQRRYVESLSSYARQFLGIMAKPDVDQIEGLSPAIAIDQKSTSRNPRSTVGTITEIYDYLRLLYARIGRPHCPNCRREIVNQSLAQITDKALDQISQNITTKTPGRFMILSPLVKEKKGQFSELLTNLKQKGFQRVRIDQQIYNLDDQPLLIKTNRHTIEAVIERITFSFSQSKNSSELARLKSRLSTSLETCLNLSDGLAIVSQIMDPGLTFPEKPTAFKDRLYSEKFSCPDCNISLPELEPRIFSFNSPQGACPTCHGLGSLQKIDPHKIIAPNLTINEGAIIPFASQMSYPSWHNRILQTLLNHNQALLKTPWKDLPDLIKQKILYGDRKLLNITSSDLPGKISSFNTKYEGVINNLERRYRQTGSDYIRQEISRFMSKEICPDCRGQRLKPEALAVTIDKLNLAELTSFSIKDTFDFINQLNSSSTPLTKQESLISSQIIKEILTRLKFLLAVGRDYLSLSRESATLAGGEAQRIRLASQIGTGLTGVIYILDEPSIGLHQRDNHRLITTLKNLRDLGNSVIVVEHDREIMLQSDHILDFGPLAGQLGGRIVAQGTPKQIIADSKSLTGKYLKGQKISATSTPPLPDKDNFLVLKGCTQNNLKNINLKLPLNHLVVISGVSGSGKSSLIHDTLYPAIKHSLNRSINKPSDNFQSLSGIEKIDKVSLIDQSPIGRTPRSNPATYTKAFDYIRQLFSNTKEAKIAGYLPGRFSFNVKGGRCEACRGEGQVKIEMQFMADVYITCEVCHGTRYHQDTLEIEYNNKNIAQALALTVDEALKFFPHQTQLRQKLLTMQQVGLGYLQLGQPAPTLSGGEAQRVKLAKELSVQSRLHTLYLLDEPTTGLHFEDLKKLLKVLKQLVSAGNTVIVIEHNLDIIKNADWIVDLGPEGGDKGGQIVAAGTPSAIAKTKQSYTGQFLKKNV